MALSKAERAERAKTARKRWKERNPEWVRQQTKALVEDGYFRDYRKENRARLLELQRLWRENNPERHAANTARRLLSRELGLKPQNIPEELVEARASVILVKRSVSAQAMETRRAETAGSVRKHDSAA